MDECRYVLPFLFGKFEVQQNETLIGLILLIVFIVMAVNIGSILQTLKRIEVYLFAISNGLDMIVGKSDEGLSLKK